ncbi:MAG: hypothetical protein NC203_00675 [Firmicutes bacterium]|nr:hypothetical protein [Bacillota bacterium]
MNNQEKNSLYALFFEQIDYWKDENAPDLDSKVPNGDWLISLWLPLRYALAFYQSEYWVKWVNWEQKDENNKLKKCERFLTHLKDNIEAYLPSEGEITKILSRLFALGRTRCNFIILPKNYSRWNIERGLKYHDYTPHWLYDKMKDPDTVDLIKDWVKQEQLQMFFSDNQIDTAHIRDLAGTGDVTVHKTGHIKGRKRERDMTDVPTLLQNYVNILEERQLFMPKVYEARERWKRNGQE